MFDYTVKDSTLYPDRKSLAVLLQRDANLKIGIVRELQFTTEGDIPYYIVEVIDEGQQVPVRCRNLTRFGGPRNFEEYRLRPYAKTMAGTALSKGSWKTRAGDVVVVAYLNGDSREGVILGGLDHPGRTPALSKDSTGYVSQYNGVEQKIDDDGSFTVTFKGPDVTDALLNTTPTFAIPTGGVSNPLKGGTFTKFHSDGSYEINDGAALLPQSIKFNKGGGEINITSGLLTLDLNKLDSSFKLTNLETTFKSDVMFSVTSTQFEVDALATAKIKGTQVAIGNDTVELIDTICKLIEALGAIVVTSPNGPCNPFQGAPQWVQVEALKTLLTGLKGSL